jgi:hypothetical protein
MAISAMGLKSIIQNSFDCTIKLQQEPNFNKSNSLKSSALVSNLGNGLCQALNNPNANLNVIKVDSQGHKSAGEWLLDITITTNDCDGFKKDILWAVESETNCGWKAFCDDFAKLVHVNAHNYLYMNGLNHSTSFGMSKYVSERLIKASSILSKYSIECLFFGFWASPCKPKNGTTYSIWDEISLNKFQHLQKIQLYKYQNGTFSLVN